MRNMDPPDSLGSATMWGLISWSLSPKSGDEMDERVADIPLVAGIVVLEPLAIIVVRKLGQELEQGGSEVR